VGARGVRMIAREWSFFPWVFSFFFWGGVGERKGRGRRAGIYRGSFVRRGSRWRPRCARLDSRACPSFFFPFWAAPMVRFARVLAPASPFMLFVLSVPPLISLPVRRRRRGRLCIRRREGNVHLTATRSPQHSRSGTDWEMLRTVWVGRSAGHPRLPPPASSFLILSGGAFER
jgi:hypothetical protein